MNGEDVKEEGELIKSLNKLIDELSKNNYGNVLDELKSKVKKLGPGGRVEGPMDKELEKNKEKAAKNKASLYKTLQELKNKVKEDPNLESPNMGKILEALSNNIASNPS